MNIKVVNTSSNPLPKYATEGSVAMDLQANIMVETTTGVLEESMIIIEPHDRTLIKTGLFIELPLGYEAQIRPRSGLAFKQGITVLNSPGTIDSDYRGEIGVILYNSSNTRVTISHGDRIAQMIIGKVEFAEWEQVKELSATARGEGGFGHTGK